MYINNMEGQAKTWAQIMEPKPKALVTKAVKKIEIEWTHDRAGANDELQAILKRETPSDHKTRVFISTGDTDLDKLCR